MLEADHPEQWSDLGDSTKLLGPHIESTGVLLAGSPSSIHCVQRQATVGSGTASVWPRVRDSAKGEFLECGISDCSYLLLVLLGKFSDRALVRGTLIV